MISIQGITVQGRCSDMRSVVIDQESEDISSTIIDG
jgi:hypothetical protein